VGKRKGAAQQHTQNAVAVTHSIEVGVEGQGLPATVQREGRGAAGGKERECEMEKRCTPIVELDYSATSERGQGCERGILFILDVVGNSRRYNSVCEAR